MKLVVLLFLALFVGLIAAYATGIFMGRKKAQELPGGSMAAGAVLLAMSGNGILSWVVGGILGVTGWVIYRLLSPLKK